jgi:hypothetical protein
VSTTGSLDLRVLVTAVLNPSTASAVEGLALTAAP